MESYKFCSDVYIFYCFRKWQRKMKIARLGRMTSSQQLVGKFIDFASSFWFHQHSCYFFLLPFVSFTSIVVIWRCNHGNCNSFAFPLIEDTCSNHSMIKTMLWPEFTFNNQGMGTCVTALPCRNSTMDDLKMQLERILTALFDKHSL